jgi:glycosyltransferase involved in cell wall biosynthesis
MAAAISKVFPGPVHVVRPALQLGSWTHSRTRKDFGLPEDRYVFFYTCDAGSVLGRKNPHALLNAFRDEFREDEGALCVIRVIYGEHNRDGVDQIRAMTGNRSDIVVMDELWSEEELRDFFAVIDCYVSPHRSEGLGLTIIDAMAAGKPVIATPYGGCADIVRADTALPLDYRIVPVGDGNQPYPPDAIWADPSVASIRAQMRKAFDHRHEAQDIGQRGNAEVRRLFGFEPAAARIGEAVAEIERRQSRP